MPEKLRGTIKLGARLKVPFGKRTMTGYAVELHAELPADIEIDKSKIKDIIEVSDDEPLITPEILKLTQWTADYYASFWGEMLKATARRDQHRKGQAKTAKSCAADRDTRRRRNGDADKSAALRSSKRSIDLLTQTAARCCLRSFGASGSRGFADKYAGETRRC